MSYDETIHQLHQENTTHKSELLFIGTNITTEKRGAFLAALIRANIPISIYGDRWQRSAYWSILRPHVFGSSLADRTYSHRLSQSLLSLGMLSRQNRDLHTRRSVEVPVSGGTLLAARTSEHKLLYEENYEAIFWSELDECIRRCKYFLSHPSQLQLIRNLGYRRVTSLGVGNEDICRQVLSSI
jgi:hypothetical protein